MTTVEYLWPFIMEFAKGRCLEEYSKWVSDEDAVYERYMNMTYQNLSLWLPLAISLIKQRQ